MEPEPQPFTTARAHLMAHGEALQLRCAAAAARRAASRATDDTAAAHLARCEAEVTRAERRLAARTAISPPSAVPLVRLERALGLSPTEVRALMLVVALELDLPLRRRALGLAGEGRTAVDVGLCAELVYVTPEERARMPLELGVGGRLTRYALVAIEPRTDVPVVQRTVRGVERVIELLHGKDVMDREVTRYAQRWIPAERDALVQDDTLAAEVTALVAASLAAADHGDLHPAALFTGLDGAGRKTLAATAAVAAGRATLRVRCRTLPRDPAALASLGARLLREARLARALVILEGIDQHAVDAPMAVDEALFGDAAIALAATCGRITGRPPMLARGTVVIELTAPAERAREELWHRALPAGTDRAVARWAAERYVVTPGVIAGAAAAAIARARARDAAAAIGARDVHEGLRGVLDAKLATLGSRITWRQTWDDLVLPDDAIGELREFIARIRHRRTVYEGWGLGKKVAKGLGLSALFSGPPGTGKTMVAGLIADELQLDLYQVDLSKVVSKWIGETEKNLGELFDAAEAGHAILLFDEADSLFAKRTEVKTSTDRYANLEVNYLLQRMESYAGIVILTTNHEVAIDEAFRRRLSLRVDFPMPDDDERQRLWRTMIPTQAPTAPDLDFDRLARRFEMSGGYIKNAALRAAFLAADDGGVIEMRHLLLAARSEYQAMGKVIASL